MAKDEIKRILGELDLYRLNKNFVNAGYGPVPVVIGDLFAVGCHFIYKGNKTLGEKLCYSALAAYDIDGDLIQRILKQIDGNEQEIATLLNPHCEIPGWLFGDNKFKGI